MAAQGAAAPARPSSASRRPRPLRENANSMRPASVMQIASGRPMLTQTAPEWEQRTKATVLRRTPGVLRMPSRLSAAHNKPTPNTTKRILSERTATKPVPNNFIQRYRQV